MKNLIISNRIKFTRGLQISEKIIRTTIFAIKIGKIPKKLHRI